MSLIDTHCHLTFPPLAEHLDQVLARAAQAGVTRVIVPAYDPASWDQVQALAVAHPDVVRPACGLHPWAADQPLDLEDLTGRLAAPETVALGEVGLDSKIEAPSLARQIAVLAPQLALAHDLDLPVILHARGAFDELLELLERFSPRLRGVVHAWSRPVELAQRFLNLGLSLGFGGAVTRPRATRARQAATRVPLERIVLETDAPSIGLEGVDPVDCEPGHVREVAVAIAGLRDLDLAEVTARTTENAERIFGR